MPRGKRNGAAPAAPAAPAVHPVAAHEATQEAREESAGTFPEALEPEPQEPKRPYDYSTLTAAQRENPACLEGEDLRRLAYQRGISRSEAGRMSDHKLREQLRFIAYRQYDR